MSKKARQDLLVRVRYLNPIPPPPFPPKLFDVPTNVHRLGEPSYLDHLASTAPFPMLVDSEMGMPLNLNNYDKIWEGKDECLNPQPDPYRVLDPADTLLLAPMKPKAELNGDAKPATVSEVSWMRTGNLFTRKAGAKKREATGNAKAEEVVDASVAGQIMAIDKSFRDFADVNTEEMRHPDPKKKHLRVVETYDILPDAETWCNTSVLIKYPERPTVSTVANPTAGASSARLGKAVLRPIREDDQQFMEFYLPEDADLEKLEQSAEKPIDEERLTKLREMIDEDDEANIDEVFTHAVFDRIRTYEVVAQSGTGEKDVLLVVDERPTKRRKGVYYKQIQMRTALRKTRAQGGADRADQWDKLRCGYREPLSTETGDREKAAGQVTDPTWANEQLRQLRGTNETIGLGEAIDDEDED